MQFGIPPVTFLLSALQYLLYNNSNNNNNDNTTDDDGHHEINEYLARVPIHVVKGTSQILADTHLGRVRGVRRVSRDGYPYVLFRGIPYAKAPVGELRYEPPEHHEGWKEPLDCYYFRSQCHQINVFTRRVVGDENCLFLNIATRKSFTFEDAPPNKTNEGLHPVMVFLHGGLFMFGSANPFGPKYFMDEEVVLVSLNYRLNSFGFFNTGDGVVAGNMGLKDQSMALKWVQDNIRYFNGDPSRVTIFGESAGAVCTHLHTLSPLSNDLFSGAISLSGTALSPWGHVDYPGIQAKEYGEGLGCPTNNSREMVACLKSLPGKTVAAYHIGYMHAASQGKQALFGPTVDSGKFNNNNNNNKGSINTFLPGKPIDLLRSGRISRKPWINGVNSGDGLVYLIPILRNDTLREIISNNWVQYAPALLAYQQNRSIDEKLYLTSAVSDYYLHGEEGISHEHLNDTGNMFSDRGFFLDSHDVGVMQSRVAPTYLYYYTYEGVFAMGNLLFYKTPLPIRNDWNYMLGGGIVWLRSLMLNRRGRSRTEVFHGDEMPLLFDIPLIRREVGKGDVDYGFSKRLIRLYVGFAGTGKPVVVGGGGGEEEQESGIVWEPIVSSQWKRGGRRQFAPTTTTAEFEDGPLRRLKIDKKFEMIDEPFYDRMSFWKRHSVSNLVGSGQQQRRPAKENNYRYYGRGRVIIPYNNNNHDYFYRK